MSMRSYRPAAFQARISAVTHSIRFRMALWFVGILALILAGFSVFIYTRQAHEYSRETAVRLEAKSRQLADYYRLAFHQEFDRDRADATQPTSISNTLPLLQEDDALLLVGAHGEILQKLGPLGASDIAPLMRASQQAVLDAGLQAAIAPVSIDFRLNGKPGAAPNYQFVVSPIDGDAMRASLILGGPLDSDIRLSQLLLTLGLGSLGILIVALGGGYWLAGRIMKPVQIITHTARTISGSDLSRRLRLNGHDELSELADTFDQMLDRLQAGFDRQRQFTADASHELRTPLTIIELEASRALGRPRSPAEYESALMTIKSENELMSRMVNDLLTLARMDAGQTILHSESLDISDVALDAVDRLTPLARQKHVELVAGDLPEVKVNGDRQFLNQMLTNLVENAIKYSSRSAHPQVHVETGHTPGSDGAGDWAWVSVQDNGPGIPAELIPKLYDRFYRVDEARGHEDEGLDEPGKPRPSGSGLGLSIVQWIVQSHGGHIDVHSRPGEGATFVVNFPAGRA
ncbi:MAG: HAMP domain-containing histidine kinase [Chloroflexi bacterium]|nr:HAMP domain-containing histidine kinase [Chloroflexota bacterium]MCL5275975.1 HAMP domain-containing histidine kinase [Chloroflexota bacterium]